jgi:hypothetical protein
MAHPDPHRAGSERDQRRHAGTISEASDAGMKDKSQGEPGTRSAERATDDLHQAPESGEKPEVMPPQRGRASGGSGR